MRTPARPPLPHPSYWSGNYTAFVEARAAAHAAKSKALGALEKQRKHIQDSIVVRHALAGFGKPHPTPGDFSLTPRAAPPLHRQPLPLLTPAALPPPPPPPPGAKPQGAPGGGRQAAQAGGEVRRARTAFQGGA